MSIIENHLSHLHNWDNHFKFILFQLRHRSVQQNVHYEIANVPHVPQMYDVPGDSPKPDRPLVYEVPLEENGVSQMYDVPGDSPKRTALWCTKFP